MATAKFEGLNVEAFEEWLTALESGDYHQGQSALHYQVSDNAPVKMCCLGVVSHLMAPKCGVQVTMFGDSWRYDNQGGYLPGKVLRYLGIPEENSVRKDGDVWSITVTMDEEMADSRNKWLGDKMYYAGDKIDVAKLNDQGVSFADIAKALRKEFLNA
jgi:hypothetical protein